MRVLTAEGLQAGLMALHTSDVPSLQQVRSVEGGFGTLREAVEGSQRLAVKSRGIILMGAFVPGQAEPWLQALLDDPATHPKLKAAALQALAEAEGPVPASLAAAQRTSVHSHDPRVALAAIDGLALSDPGRAFLRDLQLSADAPQLVQAHLAGVKARNEAD